MIKKKKSATHDPAATGSKRVDDKFELAPLEAARRFLDDRHVAYDVGAKNYRLRDEATSTWLSLNGNALKRVMKQWLFERCGHDVTAATLKKMIEEVDLNAPLWNPSQHPGVLVVANGVLDFRHRGAVLKPQDGNLQHEHQLDAAYSPRATCPRFLEFLHGSVSDEDARLIQKWIGGVLAGSNESQTVLALIGNPGTGKGTLVELITRLVGVGLTAEMRPDKFGERFEMSAYLGRRLLITPEIPSDLLTLKGVGKLKALVGQDRMEAELKNQNRRVPVRGDFHVLVHGNRLLPQEWSPDLDAFRRRLLIVEYNGSRPTKIIPNLAEDLWAAEAAGILAWAVEGVRLYHADMRQHGSVRLTAEQQRRVDRLIPPPAKVPIRRAADSVDRDSTTSRFVSWLAEQLQRVGLRLERIQPACAMP
jgi:P4 family phage/plasmid primase-like protien